MDFIRVFNPGAADQEELLAVLELLLIEPLPVSAVAEPARTDSPESPSSK
jgi:hypothetical protein